MNKILLLACILLSYAVPSIAQQKKPVAAPKPAPVAPKPPPPYVLKKDFEAQLVEINAKINAAANAANGARKSLEGKLVKITMLDSQMQQVQEILNSASFQIAITSDSLKETRFSMEEFEKKTTANVEVLQAADNDLKSSVWTMFILAMVVALAVGGLVFFILQSKLKQANALIYHEADTVKKNAADKLEKAKNELKDELAAAKSRIQMDLTALKSELNGTIQKDKEAMNARIQEIINSLTPPEQKGSEDQTII